MLAESRIKIALQHLKHRLLNESVEHRGNTKSAHSAATRLRYLHPTHWHGLIATLLQRFPSLKPVLRKVATQLVDGHPVNSRCPFVTSHLLEGLTQVLPFGSRIESTPRR
jgi:hypothetical protein